jgi:hypothetical protein
MKRITALGVFVLALAVVFVTAPVPGAFAQDPKGGGGQGSGGGSPRGGGGDGGGGARGGGGNVASAPAPSSSGGSSGGPVWSGGGTSGGNSGMSAVPRGSGGANRNAGGRPAAGASPRWSGGGAAVREGRPADGAAFGRSRTDDQVAGRSRAGAASSGVESSIPWYSRPRGANPATGTAVARPDVPVNRPPGGGGGYYPGYPGYYPGYPGYGYGGWYYDCYYYPYGCGNPWGYGGFGLGYFYLNPFGWNYGDYASWGGGGGGGSYGGQQMGGIRLKVKPNSASVYVDGYYAGTVDDFDNAFQKLSVALGTHQIEISAPGYQPLVFEIDVRDFDTIDYEGRLEPIR